MLPYLVAIRVVMFRPCSIATRDATPRQHHAPLCAPPSPGVCSTPWPFRYSPDSSASTSHVIRPTSGTLVETGIVLSVSALPHWQAERAQARGWGLGALLLAGFRCQLITLGAAIWCICSLVSTIRFAPVRFAPVRFARVRFATVRSATAQSAPARYAQTMCSARQSGGDISGSEQLLHGHL